MTEPRESDSRAEIVEPGAGPRKAYYVERVMRAVTSGIVYADSIQDAQRRYFTDGFAETFDTTHEGRGFGRVRREPDSDR